MVKVITLLKRKPGISREEFSRYWAKNHGPLIARVLPGVKRYVQNHSLKLGGRGEPQLDGVVELWYEDEKDWRASSDWYQSPAGKVVWDDEAKFIDRDKMVFFVAKEKVIKP